MSRKTIAVLCSGGDAPGMNAAVRSVVRAALARGWHVLGVERGYQGLLEERLNIMTHRSVSGIIHRGGTVLKTSRSRRFRTPEGVKRAAEVLREYKISALVVIGGNGSCRGLLDLSEHWNGQTIALPGTIDNDLNGTDYTIGYDTAVNVALEAIDRLRDTAESLERTFIVEVMGRDSGFNALDVALAAGAEQALIPEVPVSLGDVLANVQAARAKGKTSNILVVAEGFPPGGAASVARYLTEHDNPDFYRLCVLGHVQRGGAPTAKDRLLATRLGAAAVEALDQGASGVLVGEIAGRSTQTPLRQAVDVRKPAATELLDLLDILSR